MTVFIVYERGYPQTMRVFRSRRQADRFVAARLWPRNWIVRNRKVQP